MRASATVPGLTLQIGPRGPSGVMHMLTPSRSLPTAAFRAATPPSNSEPRIASARMKRTVRERISPSRLRLIIAQTGSVGNSQRHQNGDMKNRLCQKAKMAFPCSSSARRACASPWTRLPWSRLLTWMNTWAIGGASSRSACSRPLIGRYASNGPKFCAGVLTGRTASRRVCGTGRPPRPAPGACPARRCGRRGARRSCRRAARSRGGGRSRARSGAA